jgi:ABC-type multidrug transport system fused ATPase/permease subunit
MNEHSPAEIWEALEKVSLKAKFEAADKDGLETMVEQGGENLSFGERQLVCMARAMLRKTKIVLMDEATSNIDVETEHLIEKSLQECFRGCTMLTIAHRVNTIMNSDR